MKVVWFSEIKWDYLKTRKQQIISKRPRDVELLFLEPYARGRSNLFFLRKEGGIHIATVPFLKSPPNAFWRFVLSLKLLRKCVDKIASGFAGKWIKEAGFLDDKTVFIISNIYAIDSALRLRRGELIYDCNDAHDSFPGMPPWTREYFIRTCKAADRVIASSKVLKENADSLREDGDCFFVGNGVDYEMFSLDESKLKARARSRRLTLGYIGAVAPWVDFDLIGTLAKRHPAWKIIVAGPVLVGGEKGLESITKLDNVAYLPAIPYEEVPSLLASFHIGLIPFRFNELTRGVNPNKLYEYLASGLPVVATSFSPEVEAYPGIVLTASKKDGFVSACERLAGKLASEAEILRNAKVAREIAKDKDWSVMAESFWEKVRNIVNS